LNCHADFHSLCLVSKYFYASAIRFLYRRLKIPLGASGKIVTPLHAVLSAQQQERLLRFAAGGKDGLVGKSGKGCGFDKDLSDCGEFVREFEVAHLVASSGEEDEEIRKEIIESAIENMSHLESFVWNTSNHQILRRTRRISTSLTRKPLLHSLSLSNILDADIPLLHLHPLHSVAFILESNFASLAHRPTPSTADYDIIRKILSTSTKTLKSLSLITRSGPQPHYEDERLLFGGGGEGGHKSAFEESPEGTEVMHLGNLESLTLVERLFTVKRSEVFTQAINFNNLRRLEILSCPGVELLLSAITACEVGELGADTEGASEKVNKIFPNLRTLGITATQSALTRFLRSFRGLRDLRYELECDPTDWTAPGGHRRQVSSREISKDLLEAIATHHGATLRKLTVTSFDQWKCIDEAGMKILAAKCQVLEKLFCCVGGFRFVSLFPVSNNRPAITHTPSSLSTLHFHGQGPLSESEARELVLKVLEQKPKLKTVGVFAGKRRARPFVFRVRPGGVLERVYVGDFLERGKLRAGEFGD
ncbi:hypothetical protein L873DRAFT_1679694, partial [Choiromyces venosus 120613-1]